MINVLGKLFLIKSVKNIDLTNANKIICDEIKKNPILNKILSENYLIFFKKFYYIQSLSLFNSNNIFSII